VSKRREVFEVVVKLAAAREAARQVRADHAPRVADAEREVERFEASFDARLPAARQVLRKAKESYEAARAAADAEVERLEVAFAALVPEADDEAAKEPDPLAGRDPAKLPYKVLAVFVANRGLPLSPLDVWNALDEKTRARTNRNTFWSVVPSLADAKKTESPPLVRVADGKYLLVIDAATPRGADNGGIAQSATTKAAHKTGTVDPARRQRLRERIQEHDRDALTRLREAIRTDELLSRGLELLLERWWRKDELADALGIPNSTPLVRGLRGMAMKLGIDRDLAVTEKRTAGKPRGRLLMSKLKRLEET
jgi:hypothetical protein